MELKRVKNLRVHLSMLTMTISMSHFTPSKFSHIQNSSVSLLIMANIQNNAQSGPKCHNWSRLQVK